MGRLGIFGIVNNVRIAKAVGTCLGSAAWELNRRAGYRRAPKSSSRLLGRIIIGARRRSFSAVHRAGGAPPSRCRRLQNAGTGGRCRTEHGSAGWPRASPAEFEARAGFARAAAPPL